MRSRCDRLREKALTDGAQSPNGRAWRIHARSCPKCRTELFVLETLESQARSERQHLGRDEVARLMEAARVQARQRPYQFSPLGWSLRVACIFVVCLGASIGLRMSDPLTRGVDTELNAALFPPNGARENDAVPLGNPAAEREGAIREACEGPGGVAVPVGDTPAIEKRFQGLRRGLYDRRKAILNLMERDLGEQMREDVWGALWFQRLLAA